jgi:hypothetical protein
LAFADITKVLARVLCPDASPLSEGTSTDAYSGEGTAGGASANESEEGLSWELPDAAAFEGRFLLKKLSLSVPHKRIHSIYYMVSSEEGCRLNWFINLLVR